MREVHTFRRRLALAEVSQADYDANNHLGAGRVGTIVAPLADLVAAFGDPYVPGNGDGKVTKIWSFHTPRGPAFLRDYWWNNETEWSIGARDVRARRWLRLYVEAVLGTPQPRELRHATVPEALR